MDVEMSTALGRLEGKVDALDNKLDAFTIEHVSRMATLELRVTTLESERDKSRDRRWPIYVALVSSITSPIGAVIVAVLLK